MDSLLAPGQVVHLTTSDLEAVVAECLGSGGQGEVYEALVPFDPDVPSRYALKWYFAERATDAQWNVLSALVDMGPPDRRFLWPLDLARAEGIPGYGYLMALRAPEYRSMTEVMTRAVDASFLVLATAGVELADGFLRLHARGLCYRDISFGNVFIDPTSGSVAICDNDNVGVDRAELAGVRGTLPFMAPEVVLDRSAPTTASDLHSLAVLLFYLFVRHHPLEGRAEADVECLDVTARIHLYGEHPVFIFDPDDPSNEPVPGWHDNAILRWPVLPRFIRSLFIRAFTSGLADPEARVRESEWRAAMARLRDSVVHCATCGEENLFDLDEQRHCWSCAAPLTPVPAVEVGGDVVVLEVGTALYAHHLGGPRYDFADVRARVTAHPKDASVLGLTNLSASTWEATLPDGERREVLPGRSIAIRPGTAIRFGTVEAAAVITTM